MAAASGAMQTEELFTWLKDVGTDRAIAIADQATGLFCVECICSGFFARGTRPLGGESRRPLSPSDSSRTLPG
jgi:hypothetical protein